MLGGIGQFRRAPYPSAHCQLFVVSVFVFGLLIRDSTNLHPPHDETSAVKLRQLNLTGMSPPISGIYMIYSCDWDLSAKVL